MVDLHVETNAMAGTLQAKEHFGRCRFAILEVDFRDTITTVVGLPVSQESDFYVIIGPDLSAVVDWLSSNLDTLS